MKTKRAVSTISYNTHDTLVRLLNDLVDSHVLDYWFFIRHDPEADELKSHVHLYMQPSKSVDTFSLREFFRELDPADPNLPPLGVLPFRNSTFLDWCLYSVHHSGYLLMKNEFRKWRYDFDDFACSNDELFKEMVRELPVGKYRCYELIFDAVENKRRFCDLVASGDVPLNMISTYKVLFDSLVEARCHSDVQRSLGVPHGDVAYPDFKNPFDNPNKFL